jgi:hypothetical protein
LRDDKRGFTGEIFLSTIQSLHLNNTIKERRSHVMEGPERDKGGDMGAKREVFMIRL